MLGLTATPERMDGRNIYEICDYNVPYEISLKEAINKGMLVPFHYYGIYDETDYSSLHLVKGRYDEKELNETYIGNVKRYDLIYKYYMKYRSKRAIGFCCSRKHAEEMAKEFCKRGIESVAVYSNADGEFSEDRDNAIQKLKNQEIKVIFSVDMFNEGVDIANLDMVMFLRPTESPIVFLQQLGRGLRTSKGKEYLNVLDFIGNYEKAGRAPLLLSGGKDFADKAAGSYNDGDVRMAVSEEDVLSAWKKFFDNGTNWKDFADGISYSDYKAMTDKQHIAKAKSMPVKFLKSSGKGFFIDKEGYVIAIREDLEKVICKEAFKKHMKDILEYRTMEYYRRRYRGE